MVKVRWEQLLGVWLSIPDDSMYCVTVRELLSCQTGVGWGFILVKQHCWISSCNVGNALHIPLLNNTNCPAHAGIGAGADISPNHIHGKEAGQESDVATRLRFQNAILSSLKKRVTWKALKFLKGKIKFNFDTYLKFSIVCLLLHNIKYSHWNRIMFSIQHVKYWKYSTMLLNTRWLLEEHRLWKFLTLKI